MTYATDTTDAVREVDDSPSPSDFARTRMLSLPGEPLFFADWMRVLMMHFEVDAERLQRDVPYQLDLHEGRAFVTLVAFTMENMRPLIGGKLGAWLFKPIATHDFLNMRTYVRCGSDVGIHFLAEWLSNRLAVRLGPLTFGLPYRFASIRYEHHWLDGELSGRVTDTRNGGTLEYRAELEHGTLFVPCESGSFDSWLMERYSAFNCAGGRNRFFRVWHPPWPQCRAIADVHSRSLITNNWPWFGDAELVSANFSPGLPEVWMGWPRRISRVNVARRVREEKKR